MELEVSSDVRQQLVAQATDAHPRECCGILLGARDKGDQITAIRPANNIHPQPETHFDIDPQALIDAHRDAREGGPQVIGYYHSHPDGLAEPSVTDQQQAARDGSIWAIIASDEITFWRDAGIDGEGGFEPLPYRIVDR